MEKTDDWSRPAHSGVVTFHANVAALEAVGNGVEVTLADGSVFFHRPGDEPRLVSAPNGIN